MYTCSQIAGIIGAKIIGVNDFSIHNIVLDSRKLVSPSDSIFFALAGSHHDGHLFIPDLYQAGLKCFVVNSLPDNFADYSYSVFLLVDDTLRALQKLASYHRSQFGYPVVAITGSNGKTIVKEWLSQVLGSRYNLIRSPKSYNSQTGVPLSVWGMNEKHQLAIFEAGISMPGEMDKLEKIIKPDIGIFTCLGQAHQENFLSLKQKAEEKLRLFRNCKKIILNIDDEIVVKAIKNAGFSKNTEFITWSKEKKDAALVIVKTHKEKEFCHIEGLYKGRNVSIDIPFTDNASFINAVNVWLFLLSQGEPDELISQRMKLLSGIAMRLEMKKGRNNCTIINDSYNSDPGSLQIAIDFLMQQNQHQDKVVILSDILQSGMHDEQLYFSVAELVKQKKIDLFIGIGKAISKYRYFFESNSLFFETTALFLNYLQMHPLRDKAILLKGARKFEFEQISDILQYQAHRTVFEINLNALEHNFHFYKSLLNRETKICAMVKAFSYGIGTYEIAGLLQFLRVDYLAVAFADEGVTLRRNGITTPVIIMNPEPGAFDMMIEYNLEPEIYSMNLLMQFNKVLQQYNFTDYPIHLKFDTGMHRSGFLENETGELIQFLVANKIIRVASVFTHLAASDESEHDDFTLNQISVFEKIYFKISSELKYKPIRHVLNSAGIERFPQYQFEMVRLGIGLYGVGCIYNDKLQEVGQLKSTIMQVKTFEIGETIGYGRHGKIFRPSQIATVPVGYADGLRRNLGNGNSYMLVKGQKAPVIGNICMDMTMIDVTGLDTNEGDEVIIFGQGLPVTKLAEMAKTIPYEILTGISGRVKRIYYRE